MTLTAVDLFGNDEMMTITQIYWLESSGMLSAFLSARPNLFMAKHKAAYSLHQKGILQHSTMTACTAFTSCCSCCLHRPSDKQLNWSSWSEQIKVKVPSLMVSISSSISDITNFRGKSVPPSWWERCQAFSETETTFTDLCLQFNCARWFTVPSRCR